MEPDQNATYPDHNILQNRIYETGIRSTDNKAKQLTVAQRNGVLQFLLQRLEGTVLRRGAIVEAATYFSVSKVSIYRLWKTIKTQIGAGCMSIDVTSKKKNCGRKKKD